MRRREVFNEYAGQVPAKIAKFNPADWDARDEPARYYVWLSARSEWKKLNGVEQFPDDDAVAAAAPDGVFYPDEI